MFENLETIDEFPYRKSTIDRYAEIKSIPKLGHTEQVLEDKIEN